MLHNLRVVQTSEVLVLFEAMKLKHQENVKSFPVMSACKFRSKALLLNWDVWKTNKIWWNQTKTY